MVCFVILKQVKCAGFGCFVTLTQVALSVSEASHPYRAHDGVHRQPIGQKFFLVFSDQSVAWICGSLMLRLLGKLTEIIVDKALQIPIQAKAKGDHALAKWFGSHRPCCVLWDLWISEYRGRGVRSCSTMQGVFSADSGAPERVSASNTTFG